MPPDARREKSVAVVLVGCLAVALWIAVTSPARAYELSVYGGPPVSMWVFLVVATGIGIVAAVVGRSRPTRLIGAGAVASASLVIFSLPLLRSYHFYGTNDPMSYLGMSRDVLAGLPVDVVIYPSLPVFTTLLHVITGSGLEHVWVMTMPLFAICFVLGIVLTVRVLDPRPPAITIALIAAALFLPLNQVSRAGVFSDPSPTTAAIFLTPMVLFLVVRSPHNRRLWVILALFLLGYLFVHPQQFVNVLLVVVTIAAVWHRSVVGTFVERRATSTLLASVFTTGLVFWLWVHEQGVFAAMFRVVVGGFIRTDRETTGDVSGAGESLAAVGSSIEMLFVKLFLISVLACALVGLAMVIYVLPDRYVPADLHPVGNLGRAEAAIAATIIPISGVFFVYLFATSQYFRHQGFIMVIVSVLLAPVIARAVRTYTLPKADHRVRAVAVAALIVIAMVTVGMSFLTLHQSPYIDQDSGHVTQVQMASYETAFEHEMTTIAYLRTSPSRFDDALYGFRGGGGAVERSPESARILYDFEAAIRDEEVLHHVYVTEADVAQDIDMYDETFLTHADLAFLDRRTHGIYDSGGLTVNRQRGEARAP